MIEQRNVEQRSRQIDPTGQGFVFVARQFVSRRMIVHQHQRIRQFFDGPLDDQPVIHDGSRNAPPWLTRIRSITRFEALR